MPDDAINPAPAEEAPQTTPEGVQEQPLADAAPTDLAGLDGEGGKTSEPAPAEEKTANEWLGVPEGDYTNDGIELPEGLVTDPVALNGLAEICGDMGLSQKSFATIVSKMTPILAQSQAAQVQAFRKENLTAAYGDQEMGGANWQKTMATANSAYKRYTTPALREILERTGLNTHPDMIRMFRDFGAAMSDDSTVRGRPTGQRDPLLNFYDHSDMN